MTALCHLKGSKERGFQDFKCNDAPLKPIRSEKSMVKGIITRKPLRSRGMGHGAWDTGIHMFIYIYTSSRYYRGVDDPTSRCQFQDTASRQSVGEEKEGTERPRTLGGGMRGRGAKVGKLPPRVSFFGSRSHRGHYVKSILHLPRLHQPFHPPSPLKDYNLQLTLPSTKTPSS